MKITLDVKDDYLLGALMSATLASFTTKVSPSAKEFILDKEKFGIVAAFRLVVAQILWFSPVSLSNEGLESVASIYETVANRPAVDIGGTKKFFRSVARKTRVSKPSVRSEGNLDIARPDLESWVRKRLGDSQDEGKGARRFAIGLENFYSREDLKKTRKGSGWTLVVPLAEPESDDQAFVDQFVRTHVFKPKETFDGLAKEGRILELVDKPLGQAEQIKLRTRRTTWRRHRMLVIGDDPERRILEVVKLNNVRIFIVDGGWKSRRVVRSSALVRAAEQGDVSAVQKALHAGTIDEGDFGEALVASALGPRADPLIERRLSTAYTAAGHSLAALWVGTHSEYVHELGAKHSLDLDTASDDAVDRVVRSSSAARTSAERALSVSDNDSIAAIMATSGWHAWTLDFFRRETARDYLEKASRTRIRGVSTFARQVLDFDRERGELERLDGPGVTAIIPVSAVPESFSAGDLARAVRERVFARRLTYGEMLRGSSQRLLYENGRTRRVQIVENAGLGTATLVLDNHHRAALVKVVRVRNARIYLVDTWRDSFVEHSIASSAPKTEGVFDFWKRDTRAGVSLWAALTAQNSKLAARTTNFRDAVSASAHDVMHRLDAADAESKVTAFVPINARLTDDVLASVSGVAAAVLAYHVIDAVELTLPDDLPRLDTKDGRDNTLSVRTLASGAQGAPQTEFMMNLERVARSKDEIIVDGRRVHIVEVVRAANGVAYVIDSVLVPAEYVGTGSATVEASALDDDSFSLSSSDSSDSEESRSVVGGFGGAVENFVDGVFGPPQTVAQRAHAQVAATALDTIVRTGASADDAFVAVDAVHVWAQKAGAASLRDVGRARWA